jgi:IS5 family transposase
MQRQASFAQAECAQRRGRRGAIGFWPKWSSGSLARLIERLRRLYPKGERGRPPIRLERMLRVYFLQQRYGLADEALEDVLYDSQALRSSAGVLEMRRGQHDTGLA